jgi:DNA polymerase III alpha subunit
MGFVKIADKNGECELVLFPSVYQQTVGTWERDRVVLVKGKINGKDREGNPQPDLKILVDDAREVTIDQAVAYQSTGRKPKTLKPSKAKVTVKLSANEGGEGVPRLYIRLKNAEDSAIMVAIKQIIDSNSGSTEVVLVLGADDQKQIIKLPPKIDHTSSVMASLHELVGEPNVKIR